jgi:pimeloyl-ACP methyl ester carboxylesterase
MSAESSATTPQTPAPCPAILASQNTPLTVGTPSGRIAYVEAGSGPVALFVHGVLVNKHLWRHQLSGLSDIRRCIAVDLLAHGDTEITPEQDVSVTTNADMLAEVLDALQIDQVDLVGNDSGGGICQIFAARQPERIRTLTLTNCDTHDNWPPEAFKPFVDMVNAGGLPDTLNAMLADKAVFRSPEALGGCYVNPETASDADIDTYLRPFVRNAQRTRDLRRFVLALDNKHTQAIESQLRQLQRPTLIVWGTGDIYFPVKWAHWLADAIPGAKPPVELEGERLFFVEERPEAFNQLLRDHLLATS